MRVLLRREVVVLAATLAVLALLFARLRDAPPPLRGRARVESPTLAHHPAPDPARVLPPALRAAPDGTDATQRGGGGGSNGAVPLPRDLFAEPSDTRPLPPLAFEEPPRRPLRAVAPPPVPGPEPALWGRWLLRAIEPHAELDLFAQEARVAPEPPRSLDTGEDESGAAGRTARLESGKRSYDWIQLTTLRTLFGTIANEDRYELALGRRADEPILFVQVDPRTGRESFPGQPPIAYERERVVDFGLAETAANEVELAWREVQGRVTPGSVPAMTSLAERCIAARHEAPRALEIAEDLYRRLAEYDPEDPAPRIGLARTFEAAFDFERAFAEYEDLLRRFPDEPDVLVALASLEERCLLLDSAEERLRAAVRAERTSWRAHWALGRMLLARGRTQGALDHLATANRHAPEDPGYLATRVAMRVDLARAHVRSGELATAVEELELARSLEPQSGAGQETLAALVACAVLDPELVSAEAVEAQVADGLGFDLLLGLGLHAMGAGRLEEARDRLLAAAEADPLRAPLAWRSLSHLAELVGAAEEAWRFVETAREGDPLDPWTLYQRGRLLAERDDLEEAHAAFEAALEQELDFDEALLALAEVAVRTGRHDEAERYLERAAARLPDRSEVFALRGANALLRASFWDAADAFRRALELDPGDAAARGGLAWCAYRTGDADEALVQLAELEDSRRDLPEDDPVRAWARRQIERLTDHLDKVQWQDGFERAALRNGWQVEEGAGPLVELVDGEVRIAGTFARSGRARLLREYPGGEFLSIEARLYVGGESAVRAGLFVGRERRRQHEYRTTAAASVARHRDGALEVRLQHGPSDEGLVLKADEVEFPVDRWVRLRIERGGDDEEPTVDVWLDDIPLVEGAPLPELWRSSQPVRVGVFVEGDTGRRAELRLDDVRVVHREGDA